MHSLKSNEDLDVHEMPDEIRRMQIILTKRSDGSQSDHISMCSSSSQVFHSPKIDRLQKQVKKNLKTQKKSTDKRKKIIRNRADYKSQEQTNLENSFLKLHL